MMCDEHRSRKCIAREGRHWHSPPQYVCHHCETDAHRCTVMIYIIPLVILAIVLGVFIVKEFVIKKDEESAV